MQDENWESIGEWVILRQREPEDKSHMLMMPSSIEKEQTALPAEVVVPSSDGEFAAGDLIETNLAVKTAVRVDDEICYAVPRYNIIGRKKR